MLYLGCIVFACLFQLCIIFAFCWHEPSKRDLVCTKLFNIVPRFFVEEAAICKNWKAFCKNIMVLKNVGGIHELKSFYTLEECVSFYTLEECLKGFHCVRKWPLCVIIPLGQVKFKSQLLPQWYGISAGDDDDYDEHCFIGGEACEIVVICNKCCSSGFGGTKWNVQLQMFCVYCTKSFIQAPISSFFLHMCFVNFFICYTMLCSRVAGKPLHPQVCM